MHSHHEKNSCELLFHIRVLDIFIISFQHAISCKSLITMDMYLGKIEIT